ncbi:MAG: multiprotein-bridging factor 1 family protein [Kiloniellaceae bacterium]
MITAGQLRAARGLLGWTQQDLANAAGLGVSTVKRMEASTGVVRGNTGNVWKVEQALHAAGVEFIDEGNGGAGVRWKKAKS